jgi:cytosine/adenosine deaminase-related metal-dependent hydrolase
MKQLLTAKWIAPMDRPLIVDGAIAIQDGSILNVGPAQELQRTHPDGAMEDLGEALILPGLVNAHTHLELSNCAAEPYGGNFVDWILGIRRRSALDPRSVRSSVRAGAQQCLRFGVTTVGDISQQMTVTRALLRDGPLRVVSFGETIGLAGRRARFDELFAQAVDQTLASDHLRIGISPHSPYTVDLAGFRQCIEAARTLQMPLATHLSENPEEEAFLRRHSGPFQKMWESLGYWTGPVDSFDGSALEFAKSVGLLSTRSLLAHVNYCTDAELDLLADGRASVVFCPRTHAYFRHPAHRWRQMLARGVNVAVGTDSCASSPDLNLVDDLRLLRKTAPDLAASAIWEMATIRAAVALDAEASVGSITPGKAADLVVFRIEGSDPLEEVLVRRIFPRALWIAGQRIAIN